MIETKKQGALETKEQAAERRRNETPETLEKEFVKLKGRLLRETARAAQAATILNKAFIKEDNKDQQIKRSALESDYNTIHAQETAELRQDAQTVMNDVAENRATLRAVNRLHSQAASTQNKKEAAALLVDALGRLDQEIGDLKLPKETIEFINKERAQKHRK